MTAKREGAPAARSARRKKALTDEQRRRIFCVKHGHSRLRDHFMGYHHCCRCGDQLGDSWGGAYRDDTGVYIHHMHVFTHERAKFQTLRGCKCPTNAEALTAKDFKLVPQWSGWGYEQRPPWRQKPEAGND